MGWEVKEKKKVATQLELFEDTTGCVSTPLSNEEQIIVDCLKSEDYKYVNSIVSETGLPYNIVSSTIFDLESKGIIETVGGNRIKLQK
jgi:predicted Rossmann fold nucleotide-binding protein DprA/Smf involved in DNA uptake